MKKTIVLFAVLLLCIDMLFAATSTRFTKYGKIFNTGEYTLKGQVQDFDSNGNAVGEAKPMLMVMSDGNMYIESIENGEKARIIYSTEGSMSIISDAEKSVLTISGDQSESNMAERFTAVVQYETSGTERFNGKSLYFEKHTDEDGYITKYWYNGNDLYAIQTIVNDPDLASNSAIIIESLEQKADKSLFKIPEDYTVTDLASLFSSFTDTSSDSSWEFDWDADDGDIDWDWMWTPHYYEFGLLMGLNEKQAQEFSDAMDSFGYIDWGSMNDYLDENGRYNIKGTTVQEINYLDSEQFENIKKLIDKFKK